MPRPPSWSATIAARAASKSDTDGDTASHRRRLFHAEVRESQRSEVGDARIDRQGSFVEPSRQHGHDGVAGGERAVASTPEVMPTSEVLELPATSRGNDDLARVRAGERA